MVSRRWISVLGFLLACGSEEPSVAETEGDTEGSGSSAGDTEIEPDPIDPGAPAEPTNPHLYDGGQFWRIDLGIEFATEAVSVTGVTFLDVPAGRHEPVPFLSGDYMAIAYADAEVRGAAPVHFPNAGRMEFELEGGGMVLEVVTQDTSVSTVYLPAADDVTHVEIRSRTGEVVADIPGDMLPSMSFRSTNNPVSAAYPTIEVLLPGEESRIPQKYIAGGHVESIVTPTDAQYQAIIEQLDRLPPAQLASISTIIVAEPRNQGCWGVDVACGYEADGSVKVAAHCALNGLAASTPEGDPLPTTFLGGGAIGSYMALNTHAFPWAGGTVIHEGTHNFHNRIDARANMTPNQDAWSSAALAEAKKLVEDYNLGFNFSAAWGHIQNTALSPSGSIHTWDAEAWCGIDQITAVQYGFASPYGSSNFTDDVAEYAAEVVQFGAQASVCAQFAGKAGDEFDVTLAAPYAKLALLRQMEALTKEQFEACVQGVAPGRASEGIELIDQVFTAELKAGYYTGSDGTRYFAILGQGVEQWQLLYEIAVAEHQTPLGAHWFGNISGFTIPFGLPPNGVYLNHPMTPRASEGGMILITEASTERVTGAVFFLQLQNALGQNTSYDAYAPFLIGRPL